MGKAPLESRFGVIWEFDITGKGKIRIHGGIWGLEPTKKGLYVM